MLEIINFKDSTRRFEVEKINTIILALYIFQFGFLQILSSIFNEQYPVIIFTVLLVFISLINNRFNITISAIIIYLHVTILFLISFLKNQDIKIMNIYFLFVLKCFSGVLISSHSLNFNGVKRIFSKVAIINFVSIFLYPFYTDLYNSMNYMRFGYAMLPSLLVFYYNSKYYSNTTIWSLLTITSLYLIFIYGNRGVFISIYIYILLNSINSEKKIKKILFLIFSSIFILLLLRLKVVKRFLLKTISMFRVNSYSLNKYKLMLTKGILESSAGRNIIYKDLISKHKDKYIFGNGVGISHITLNTTPHNLIIQVLVERGIVGLLLFVSFWIFSFKKILVKDVNKKSIYIINLLFSIAIGRLLISSDMWLRPEYWVLITIVLNLNMR